MEFPYRKDFEYVLILTFGCWGESANKVYGFCVESRQDMPTVSGMERFGGALQRRRLSRGLQVWRAVGEFGSESSP